MIDLHTHTVYSDGSMTPAKLVEKAHKMGLSHIAITDHDTVSAISKAVKHSEKIEGPEVIPAIEFSCHILGEDIHILAYYIPYDDIHLVNLLNEKYVKREERFVKVIRKLQKHGFPIEPDDVKAYGSGGMKMSPQIVKVLYRKNYLKNLTEGKQFVRDFLMPGKPAYVEHGDDPQEIIDFFHQLGAITSLAHPHKIKNVKIIENIIEMGIDALEFYYPKLTLKKKNLLSSFIKENNLLATGGSDFHGIYADSKLAEANVPLRVVQDLKKALKKRSC